VAKRVLITEKNTGLSLPGKEENREKDSIQYLDRVSGAGNLPVPVTADNGEG